MSPVAEALHHRFDEVCLSELQRLRRRTASLTEADRAAVEAITRQVTHAIAGHMQNALERPEAAEIGDVVARLFAIESAVLTSSSQK